MDRLIIVTKRLGQLPSGKVNWKPRNDLVLPMVSTMELLDVQAKEWKGSLGVVRAISPKLRCEPTDDEWDARGEALLNRMTLFGEQPKPLDKIPWAFKYRYRCSDGCSATGHHQQVLDWEMAELYRKEVTRLGTTDAARDSVLFKYNEQRGPEVCDVHFFVGTLRLRPDQYSIIGVYLPPCVLETPTAPGQLTLDFG